MPISATRLLSRYATKVEIIHVAFEFSDLFFRKLVILMHLNIEFRLVQQCFQHKFLDTKSRDLNSARRRWILRGRCGETYFKNQALPGQAVTNHELFFGNGSPTVQYGTHWATTTYIKEIIT